MTKKETAYLCAAALLIGLLSGCGLGEIKSVVTPDPALSSENSKGVSGAGRMPASTSMRACTI